MTNRQQRRALLGAMIAAPVAMAPAALAKQATFTDLAELDLEGLLAHAARGGADPAFARLCETALATMRRTAAAHDAHDKAHKAALAETPPYPEGLCYKGRYTSRDGETKITDDRCVPPEGHAGFTMLWNCAHWRAEKAGISRAEAEAQLRAEYAAWKAAKDGADKRHRTAELEQAAEDASDDSCDAFDAVLAHPATDARTLLTKLYLRSEAFDFPTNDDAWDALVSDVARVVTARGAVG